MEVEDAKFSSMKDNVRMSTAPSLLARGVAFPLESGEIAPVIARVLPAFGGGEERRSSDDAEDEEVESVVDEGKCVVAAVVAEVIGGDDGFMLVAILCFTDTSDESRIAGMVQSGAANKRREETVGRGGKGVEIEKEKVIKSILNDGLEYTVFLKH